MAINSATGGKIWTPRETPSMLAATPKRLIRSKAWLGVALVAVISAMVLIVLIVQGQYFISPPAVTTKTTLVSTIAEIDILGKLFAIGAGSLITVAIIAVNLSLSKEIHGNTLILGFILLLTVTTAVTVVIPAAYQTNRIVDIQTWLLDTVGVSQAPAITLEDGAVESFLGNDAKIYTVTTQVDGDKVTLTTALAETQTTPTKEDK